MDIPFVQAKNSNKLPGRKVSLIVIHDMEYPEKTAAAEWCADFFAGRNGLTAPKASAHYCADADSIVQCVKDEDVAWHVPGQLSGEYINNISIGIEHAGYAAQTEAQWFDDYSRAMLELSAELVAQLCVKHGIVPVFRDENALKAGLLSGITGHVHCTKASGSGTHTDPGASFPWGWYMERVLAHMSLLGGRPQPIAQGMPAASENPSDWVTVEYGGTLWKVCPVYVPFVGIGQAEDIAASMGCELPTPGLVDAIWEVADLRLDGQQLAQATNGTIAEMASMAAFAKQTAKLEQLIAGRSLGKDFKLLAGAFKDVVHNSQGKLGIYGWHNVTGKPIQPFFGGHARGWIDYSQGLRLVRRA